MKFVIIIFSTIICNICFSQSFDKKFYGYWADTKWSIEFKSDGTFIRLSNGHYGNTTVNGNYVIKSDTIVITKGFQNTHKTIPEKFLIESEFQIIDLENLYDYSIDENFHSSNRIFRDYKKEDLSFSYFGYEFDEKLELNKFINSSKLLDKNNRSFEIQVFAESNDIKSNTVVYDSLGRIKMLFYFGSLVSGIKPKYYEFYFIDDSNKLLKIVDVDYEDGDVEYLFEYVGNKVDIVRTNTGQKLIIEKK